jgi:Short C-terminal domain
VGLGAREALSELQRLKDQGLVTDEEYDAPRKDILGSV